MENPVQKPYIHQEYPKRMYLEGEVESSIVVHDPDEEDEAAGNGYTSTWINHAQAEEAAARKTPKAAPAPKAAMEAAIGRNAKRVKMPPPTKATPAAEDKDEDEGDAE